VVKGRAVVASSVGSLLEQVTHQQTGLLVDPHDLPHVRTALSMLLVVPRPCRELGERARTSVLERFTMNRLVEDYAVVTGPRVEANS
jgi:glycosyltransferase involved in cell wall biosynthesis